jgi:hypothetical protein
LGDHKGRPYYQVLHAGDVGQNYRARLRLTVEEVLQRFANGVVVGTAVRYASWASSTFPYSAKNGQRHEQYGQRNKNFGTTAALGADVV